MVGNRRTHKAAKTGEPGVKGAHEGVALPPWPSLCVSATHVRGWTPPPHGGEPGKRWLAQCGCMVVGTTRTPVSSGKGGSHYVLLDKVVTGST